MVDNVDAFTVGFGTTAAMLAGPGGGYSLCH